MDLAQSDTLGGRFSFVSKNTGVPLGIAAMCFLLVMIIPMPAMLLDLFLTFNITLFKH